MNNNYLETRRKALNMTLQEVAEVIGVSKSTVLRWERGDIYNMKRDKILLYSNALKISPLYFVLDDYEIENETAKFEILDVLEGASTNTMNKVLEFAKSVKSEE